jgi:hypothetical protein
MSFSLPKPEGNGNCALVRSEETALLGRTAVAEIEEVRRNFDCACARKKIVPGTRLATLEAKEVGA